MTKIKLTLVSILLLAFSFSGLFSQNPMLQFKRMKKNKVKTVTEWKKDFGTEVKYSTTKLDTSGAVTEYTTFFTNGKPDSRKVNKYEYSNLVQEIQYNASNEVQHMIDYVYLSANVLFKKNIFDANNTLKSSFSYKYSNGKTTEETEYKPDGTVAFNHIYKYNSSNQLVEEKKIAVDGSTLFKHQYIYDSFGRKTDDVTYSYVTVSSKNKFIYDKWNNRVEETFFYTNNKVEDEMNQNFNEKGDVMEVANLDADGNSFTKNSYSYDEKGNITEKKTYDLKGRVKYRWTYKYDQRNNITEEVIYDADGSVLSRYTSEFNEKGKVTEEAKYNSYYKVSSKWSYEYDDKGRLVSEVNIGSDKKFLFKGEYQYDIKGNRLKELTYTSEDAPPSKKISQYDDNNNIIKEEFYNSDGRLEYKRSYQYDGKGNLVEVNDQNTFTAEPEMNKFTYEYY